MADRSPERVSVWLAPNAGRSDSTDLAERVVSAAAARGDDATLLPNESLEATVLAAGAAIEAGADRLVVIGGDGTIHQAIQVAARTPVAVGVVPAGSGNDFARAVGLPTDPETAIDRALGPSAPFDLLRIGDRFGATVATVGFSVDVNRRADAMRWPRGQAKYTVATILEIGKMRRFPLVLEVDGERLDVSPNLVAIANTEMFGGGMCIAPGARADDGQLDVVVIGPTSRATMLRLLPAARRGRHVRHDDVTVVRGTRVAVTSAEAFEVRADGEIVGSTPIEIEVLPGALQLAASR